MTQPPPPKLVVTINSTGRQSASFIRVASAVGWHVRAQVRKADRGLVYEELSDLPNVRFVFGELTDASLRERLFKGAQVAFVNTTHWGDEYEVGCALADAAKAAHVQHFVYSSMPDHSTFERGWKALPMWEQKYAVETYVRSIGIPSTFVYTGIYNNNFTSLPYPLFRMELQSDGSFVWQAPFHPDQPLPWLDVEHDMGPALLQIFKEGPKRWAGHRIPLAFEVLTPKQVCEAFARGLERPVKYRHGPIEFHVPVPTGYADHLAALQRVLGEQGAPYFGPTMYYPNEAIELWEGNRGMEEYAREVFPVEEASNGCTWMADAEETDGESNFGVSLPATPMSYGQGSGLLSRGSTHASAVDLAGYAVSM